MGNRTKDKPKQKYPQWAILTRFEVMQGISDNTEPAYFEARAVRSIRPAGGTWAGRVSLVSFGRDIPEVAILGSVDVVHAMIQAAAF